MKKRNVLLLSLILLFSLAGCTISNTNSTGEDTTSPVITPVEDGDSNEGEGEDGSEPDSNPIGSITLSNASPRLSILASATITPTFNEGATESDLEIGEYDTSKVLIEQANDGTHSLIVTVLEVGTDETITLSNIDGVSTTLRVRSISNSYNQVSDEDEWFDDISIDPLDSSLKEDTPIGLDISFVKQIYDNGGHYYNKDGVEENIFKIIKEAGYNTVRIKQFVDPYNYEIGDEPVTYGGGTNDLETNLWIAKFASLYDLDIMIDFHYSDFYADPTYQVIPKAWKDASSQSEMVNYITEYTTSCLNAYKNAGIDISYVQIGNETTTGILTQMPGEDYSYLTGDNPGYITNRYSASSSISGSLDGNNFVAYINAGVTAAKEVFPNVETIVHIARGFSGTDTYTYYYNKLSSVDYDIIGISGYIYYQGRPNESQLGNLLNTLETNFPSKKVMVMETSYGYTYDANSNASNTFGESLAVSGYDVSPDGQATLMRDMLNTLNNHDNTYGFMYWGGDFIPVEGSGWADSTTKSSWANQALFSYDGKALPSLYFLNNL